MKSIILITADGEPYAATPDMFVAEKVVENGKKEKDSELIDAEDISFTKVAYYGSEEDIKPLTMSDKYKLKVGDICKFNLKDIHPDEFCNPLIKECDDFYCVIDEIATDGYYDITFITNEEISEGAVSGYHLTRDVDFNCTELNQLLRMAKHHIRLRYGSEPHGKGISTYWNIDRERDCYFRIRPTNGELILVLRCSQYDIDDMKSAMKRYLNYNHDEIESIANGEIE